METLKHDIGWKGFAALASFEATAWLLAYYLLSLALQVVLPGYEVEGVELRCGGRLKYKFNSFASAVFILACALAGTIAQGADFALWTFIWDNYFGLLTASNAIAFSLACFVYAHSFSVKAGNAEKRELAAGGLSGNLICDWFMGRELNPRVILPVIGTVDIKEFCELRPGMLGWIVLDLAFIAHQYKTHGVVTDSIVLITAFQALYVFDALYYEAAVLTTMDITSDGFGFMLAFGDLVWLPFIYSVQARYLAVHPVQLGLVGTVGVLALQCLGYYMFRAANSEKNRFKTNPNDPKVAHLQFIESKSGTKLLMSGWWAMSRHINYFSDWLMAWAWCLPTGFAGYMVQRTSSAPITGAQSPADGSSVGGRAEGVEIVQGEARGWGMIFTYFYVVYFAVLLVHRERRDEQKCARKHGEAWQKYKKNVPWRIIPGIY